MKNFPKAWGKQLGKVSSLPHPKTAQSLLHMKTDTYPTVYAPTLFDLMTYILISKAYPQYQQP